MVKLDLVESFSWVRYDRSLCCVSTRRKWGGCPIAALRQPGGGRGGLRFYFLWACRWALIYFTETFTGSPTELQLQCVIWGFSVWLLSSVERSRRRVFINEPRCLAAILPRFAWVSCLWGASRIWLQHCRCWVCVGQAAALSVSGSADRARWAKGQLYRTLPPCSRAWAPTALPGLPGTGCWPDKPSGAEHPWCEVAGALERWPKSLFCLA